MCFENLLLSYLRLVNFDITDETPSETKYKTIVESVRSSGEGQEGKINQLFDATIEIFDDVDSQIKAKSLDAVDIKVRQVKLRLTIPSRVKISKILKNSTFSTYLLLPHIIIKCKHIFKLVEPFQKWKCRKKTKNKSSFLKV